MGADEREIRKQHRQECLHPNTRTPRVLGTPVCATRIRIYRKGHKGRKGQREEIHRGGAEESKKVTPQMDADPRPAGTGEREIRRSVGRESTRMILNHDQPTQKWQRKIGKIGRLRRTSKAMSETFYAFSSFLYLSG
jgi:hypothetical protein